MNLEMLLTQIEYCDINGEHSREITGLCFDSRSVKSNDVFFCIKGFLSDGHRFAAMAAEKGASVIVAQDPVEGCEGSTVVTVADTRIAMAQFAGAFYDHPSKKVKVIGVTGTNGKTTVTNLVKSIFDMAGIKIGLIGTNEIIVGDRHIQSERTTPEAPLVQYYLNEMASEGIEYCVMEISSHSLELHRVTGMQFHLGVFTNLTHEHLDLHGSMENYAACKAKLFRMCKQGLVNRDDKYSGVLLQDSTCDRVQSYAIDSGADFRARNITLSDRGVIFDCVAKEQTLTIKMPMPGRFSVYNALAAVGICMICGIDGQSIERGLRITKGAKGRAEFVPVNAPFRVMIDYAHTPDGLENILTTIRDFCNGRIITVFGAPGDRDALKRKPMGEMVVKYSDFAIVTSDNPAGEQAEDIIMQIETGMTGFDYIVQPDRENAIHAAIDMAREGDVILLAGKGHETYQIVGKEKVPFNEEEIVQKYLANKA